MNSKYDTEDHIYKTLAFEDLSYFAARWGNEDVDYAVHEPEKIAALAEKYGANLHDTFLNVYQPYNPSTDGTSLRASMLGKHALVILSEKFLGTRVSQEVPRRAKATMAVGTLWEHIAMMELELEGWDIEVCQRDLSLFEGMVSGHPDAIVESPSGERMILEFKTMNSRYFGEISAKRGDGMTDDRGYITQLSLYSQGLQLPAAWMCFNKDTSELYVEQLTKRKADKAFARVDKLMRLWAKVECWDDMFKYCRIPEPIPEIYKQERTGRYFVPYEFRDNIIGNWIFETSEELNNYNRPVQYITAINYPEDCHEKQRHLHAEFGHLIEFASAT